MKPAASDIVDEAPAGAAASVERVQPAPRPGEAAPGELGGRLAGLSLPRQVAVLAVWPLLEQLIDGRWPLRYIGRARNSSPSEGSSTWHAVNQRAIIAQTFEEKAETPEVQRVLSKQV